MKTTDRAFLLCLAVLLVASAPAFAQSPPANAQQLALIVNLVGVMQAVMIVAGVVITFGIVMTGVRMILDHFSAERFDAEFDDAVYHHEKAFGPMSDEAFYRYQDSFYAGR